MTGVLTTTRGGSITSYVWVVNATMPAASVVKRFCQTIVRRPR